MLNKFLMIIMLVSFLALTVKAQDAVELKNKPLEPCKAEYNYKNLTCMEEGIVLIDNLISIRVYTREPPKITPRTTIDRTFVVVHNNEQKGLNAVKEVLAENGSYGRLVEVVSNYKDDFNLQDTSNKYRYLHFNSGRFCIDPNRIYTEIGLIKALEASKCEGTTNDIDTRKGIKKFADELLKIITLSNTKTPHRFIIGVHNNTVDKSSTDLALNSYSDTGDEAKTALGIFVGNKHGNSPSTFDTETDNFILTTNGYLAGQFLDNRIYPVALQEGKEFLIQDRQRLDDGSMSIYFITEPKIKFSYINIEAGGKKNNDDDSKKWQKEIIKMVVNKRKIKI